MMTAVVNNGFRWWDKEECGPRLFVLGCALLLGAGVAAAAGSEMSGPWPAFVIGIGAPATIRGLLSGVQVGPKLELETPRADVPNGEAGAGSRRPEEKEAGENVR